LPIEWIKSEYSTSDPGSLDIFNVSTLCWMEPYHCLVNNSELGCWKEKETRGAKLILGMANLDQPVPVNLPADHRVMNKPSSVDLPNRCIVCKE
jgi:hypothetical protein